MTMVFIDTEFTDFLHPDLLSLGMVAIDGREHYVKLDLACEQGVRRFEACSDFVRDGGILDMWGRVPGATATPWEMGRRRGEWPLSMAQGERMDIVFDYPTDYDLIEEALRDAFLWEQAGLLVRPVNIDRTVGRIGGEAAAEESFLVTEQQRGLGRHHALADVIAHRAAYCAVQAHITRPWEDRAGR